MEHDMLTSAARATDLAGLAAALKKGSHAAVNPHTSELAQAVHKHLEERERLEEQKHLEKAIL